MASIGSPGKEVFNSGNVRVTRGDERAETERTPFISRQLRRYYRWMSENAEGLWLVGAIAAVGFAASFTAAYDLITTDQTLRRHRENEKK
ncbi:hypothetical protein SeMB42_g01543 [Synchytrium endobioticum]|uniref:Uncharacterized protein n=1 Tax=Synchytrium endobioticum TaxID=286115 RepID=A0A507DLH1_9FUNG|nr:hypothetical protein SeLEV6574_g04408 [Synchytrium endobioticum]TPX52271.1 hypothetical protein SeMB42_g01543 [Synchytrium endobioticum]